MKRILTLFFDKLSLLFHDIYLSFKYNKSKFAGVLLFVPAILIGLFLSQHASSVQKINENVKDFSKYIGIYLFGLVLIGCINIFNAFSVIAKRNLFSSISSAVCTLLLLMFGGLYLNSFFTNWKGISVDSVLFTSLFCVGVSMLCSLVGTIISFIFMNRNYKKDI